MFSNQKEFPVCWLVNLIWTLFVSIIYHGSYHNTPLVCMPQVKRVFVIFFIMNSVFTVRCKERPKQQEETINTYVLGFRVQFGIEDPGQEKNKCLTIILVSSGRGNSGAKYL